MLVLADFPGDLILPLGCGCWLLPLLALGLTYGLFSVIRRGINHRGVGSDGIYCAKCKFDVRGGVHWDCPECGNQLRQHASPRFPCGGIVSSGIDPPTPHLIRILFYLFVCGFPIAAGLMILGMLLPINYRPSAEISLYLPDPTDPAVAYEDYVPFEATAERSWTGSGRLASLESWLLEVRLDAEDYRGSDLALKQVLALIWDELVATHAWLKEDAEYELIRAEFIAIFSVMGEMDEQAVQAQASRFKLDWSSDSEADFHPLYTPLASLVWLALIVLVIRRALRDGQSAESLFYTEINAVQAKYAHLVEQNYKRMNTPKNPT